MTLCVHNTLCPWHSVSMTLCVYNTLCPWHSVSTTLSVHDTLCPRHSVSMTLCVHDTLCPWHSVSKTLCVHDTLSSWHVVSKTLCVCESQFCAQSLLCLNGQCHEICTPVFVLWTNQSRPLVDMYKHFKILLRFHGDICIQISALNYPLITTWFFKF